MPDHLPLLSVAQFATLMNTLFEDMGEFQVVGEITELRLSGKGGVFITLKDTTEAAILNLGNYKPNIRGIDLVQQGMQVIVTGVPNLYAPYGKFSLQITAIEPFGEGALKIAFERLKALLAADGLFAAERKKSTPDYFERIALITAKDSAAYSDFVKILQENHAGFGVDFFPVTVQGSNSVGEILAALHQANQGVYDAVVMIRGGGSLEDLKSFNDEQVVRQLAVMRHFTMVGVGHERDESLCDLAADLRASTPSQAAVYLYTQNRKFLQSWQGNVATLGDQLVDRLDALHDKLTEAGDQMQQALAAKIDNLREMVGDQSAFLLSTVDHYQQTFTYFHHLEKLIASYSPQKTLARGYAIVRNHQGKAIASTKQLEASQVVTTQLQDGSIVSTINEIHHDQNHPK